MDTWIKPTFKRDLSQLGSNQTGFLTVTGEMRIVKGGKHSVAGNWNMMGFNEDVVRGRKKNSGNAPEGKGAYQIYVRKVNGVRFPINVIPGNKIPQCKKRIHQKRAYPSKISVLLSTRLSLDRVLATGTPSNSTL